jgi:hypothetical protein
LTGSLACGTVEGLCVAALGVGAVVEVVVVVVVVFTEGGDNTLDRAK